jgi:hypothetical protein
MSIADVIVIYLAVGAPFAVYQYFQNRRSRKARRLFLSVFALLFWPAVAAGLVIRQLTNAYSDNHFVSDRHLDVSAEKANEIRKRLSTELVGTLPELSVYDLRDVLDRYVGLSIMANETTPATDGPPAFMFSAAGRERYELGVLCLTRRNRRRVLGRHSAVRYEFLNLFERLSERHPKRDAHLALGIDLARELKDDNTVDLLQALASNGRPGQSIHDKSGAESKTAIGSPLRMRTISPSSD